MNVSALSLLFATGLVVGACTSASEVAATTQPGAELIGCWERRVEAPGTPLGISSVKYCFGKEGAYSAFFLDFDDGWDASGRYTTAGDRLIFRESGASRGSSCRWKVRGETLTFSDCEASGAYTREKCEKPVFAPDGAYSCATWAQ